MADLFKILFFTSNSTISSTLQIVYLFFTDFVPAPGRSRIQVISNDSDSDTTPVKAKTLGVYEKEQLLKQLTKNFPQHENLVIIGNENS
jgi:hypothetical protein